MEVNAVILDPRTRLGWLRLQNLEPGAHHTTRTTFVRAHGDFRLKRRERGHTTIKTYNITGV